MRALACVAVLLAAAGCSTTYETRGRPVPYGEASGAVLRPGKTTRADVLALFGAPTDVAATRDGESFQYLYEKRKSDGVDVGFSALFGLLGLSVFRTETGRASVENLTVLFDGAGVLEAWSYTPGRP